jgi:hypothetical protein
MSAIKVVPDVLIHRFLVGGVITGVVPTGVSYTFDYDNEAGGPFTLGEAISWTGGTGSLAVLVDDGATGSMTILLATGVAPSDGLTITGGASSATADVDGDITLVNYSDSVQTVRRGRYRLYSDLTDGGLVDIAEEDATNGFGIRSVLINVPGITSLQFSIVDRDGNAVSAGTELLSGGGGYIDWKGAGVVVPPGCKFKATGVGTVSSAGEIMFVFCPGWRASIFDNSVQLGSSNLVPDMDRT